jgi:hypothetical protein
MPPEQLISTKIVSAKRRKSNEINSEKKRNVRVYPTSLTLSIYRPPVSVYPLPSVIRAVWLDNCRCRDPYAAYRYAYSRISVKSDGHNFATDQILRKGMEYTRMSYSSNRTSLCTCQHAASRLSILFSRPFILYLEITCFFRAFQHSKSR